MKAINISQIRRTRRVALRLFPALALLFTAACENKPAYTPPPPPQVTVGQPVRQKVSDSLELTGNLQAANTVQLRARVEGYLDKALFEDGQNVKKDQLLFLIQQNTYLARLQQAEGNVLAQKARLDHAEIELTRYTNLFNQKAAAKTDVDTWRYERDAARASLMTAEAQRDLAKLDFSYTWVTAPFDGRIDRRLVDPGNLVGAGESTVLAQLTQMDPLDVYFTISEADVSPVLTKPAEAGAGGKAAGFPIAVGLVNEKGYPHKGYLDFAAPTVTSSTGTLLVRGVVPNPDGQLLPGQFARVNLTFDKERNVLLVPRVAVATDEQGSYVLLVSEQNLVERRNVTTGAPEDEFVVIEEGLKGDEWVVVNGLLRAIPGRTVTPERQTPSADAAGKEASGSPPPG